MKSKNCECCMMPLEKDQKESGSNKYCSYCFVGGRLLAEGLSLRDFQKKSYEGMIKNGKSKPVAWFFSKMIGFAPYWKTR